MQKKEAKAREEERRNVLKYKRNQDKLRSSIQSYEGDQNKPKESSPKKINNSNNNPSFDDDGWSSPQRKSRVRMSGGRLSEYLVKMRLSKQQSLNSVIDQSVEQMKIDLTTQSDLDEDINQRLDKDLDLQGSLVMSEILYTEF